MMSAAEVLSSVPPLMARLLLPSAEALLTFSVPAVSVALPTLLLPESVTEPPALTIRAPVPLIAPDTAVAPAPLKVSDVAPKET